MKVSGLHLHGTYDTAITVASFIAFVGWALVVIGVFIVVGGLSAGAPYNIMIGGIGFGIGAMGLLQVAAGQMLRASVDTADYSRQELVLQLALAEGRTEIDLQRPSDLTQNVPFAGSEVSSRTEKKDASAHVGSDLTMGLSEEAISVLRRAKEKGYVIHFSPDKKSVILSSGGWQASFSSEDEIVKFGRDIR
jgi:hypothetical protein